MTTIHEKIDRLTSIFHELESCVVALSGGVDSSVLAIFAHETLGNRMFAVTARSEMFPEQEYQLARAIAKTFGFRHETIASKALDNPEITENPIDRCFWCKKLFLTQLKQFAIDNNLKHVVEGSNIDDVDDYRPGMKAVQELGIRSPLLEAGLTKIEIREIAKQKGLLNWDRPSSACLASRIPYGQPITIEKLKRIEKAENILHDDGFRIVRVRDWDNLAIIELGQNEISKVIENATRHNIVEMLRKCGYERISLDLEGYRTGSLNEQLDETQ